jgi:AAA+ superfamily predicted ATPase
MTGRERFVNEMLALLKARYPIVYLLTPEEGRAVKTLQDVASTWGASTFYIWSFTDGWTDYAGNEVSIGDDRDRENPRGALNTVYSMKLAHDAKALFVLKDFDVFLDDAGVVRRIRDCDVALRTRPSTIVITSPRLVLPPHLQKTLHVVDFPLPDRDEIASLVDAAVRAFASRLAAKGDRKNVAPTPEVREEVIRLLQGLTWDEADNIVAKSLAVRHCLDPALVAAEKKAAIRKTEVLEIVTTDDRLQDVGGHDALKEWLQEAQLSFSDDARAFGVEPVKGMICVGVPGTGKSFIIKAAANDWRLPLVRVDIGRLMGSLVGESEARARQLTQVLEASAPVVAWMDEIEKGIGGVHSSAFSDSGTTARVFGHLLTWMQETKAPVFIAATANDISLLPPELLRRFDAVWYFDVPSYEERLQIWAIHLRKRGRDPQQYDLHSLAAGSDGYTGAEIEKAVKQALRRAYLEGKRPITEADLLGILRSAQPLAVSRRDQLRAAEIALAGIARKTSAPAAEQVPRTGTPAEAERVIEI